MFVVNKKYSRNWGVVSEVGTGDTFVIQPIYKDVEYIVKSSSPSESEYGGVIPMNSQLMFKKVGGDLYLRDIDDLSGSFVHIERVEEE